MTEFRTEAAPILFTADAPSVRWLGLRFENTPPGSNFTYCTIEYASSSGLTLINAVAPVVDHCTFQNNSSTGAGGAINATGTSGSLDLQDCTFRNNSSSGAGGAINAASMGGSLSLQSCSFFGNASAGGRGGAVSIQGGDASIADSVFRGNSVRQVCGECAARGFGGGLFVDGSANVSVRNSQFIGNDAYASGNGNYCGSGEAYGSGVYVNSGAIILKSSLLSCNTARADGCSRAIGGLALYVAGGAVTVENSTIARNASAAGVHIAGGKSDIKNSIIYFNNSNGAQVGGTANITYSDVQGGVAGEGNINFNPAFEGTGCEPDDFKLLPGSPAIDAGNPDSQYNDTCFPPSTGNDAQHQALNDMGAFGGPGACGWGQ